MHYNSDYPELLTQTVTVNRGRLEYPLQYDVAEGKYGLQVTAIRSVEHSYHDRVVVEHEHDSLEAWLAYLWNDGHVDYSCYNLRDWYRAAQACKYCGILITGTALDNLIDFTREHDSGPGHWDDVRKRCDEYMQRLEATA